MPKLTSQEIKIANLRSEYHNALVDYHNTICMGYRDNTKNCSIIEDKLWEKLSKGFSEIHNS